MASPWQSDGEWLKCQLHAHTVNSDGEATPEGLVEHYARAGYDVLAITDHWHVTPFEHAGILVLPSAELSARIESAKGELASMNGAPGDVFWTDGYIRHRASNLGSRPADLIVVELK